jgi:7,8-dihydropterin-6-yl-methyl-4-(beta-D-ribofuranosyl)aminobenzene 5'-phosphate synthase
MDKTTLTVLVDNQAGFGCVAEHGFALWIEHGEQHILLDTGQGTALEGNARTLGIDLGRTDALVLSHGHYDHTGAVPLVLGAAPGSRVHCHPGVTEPRYSISGGEARDIRMPLPSMRALGALPAERLHWIGESREIGAGVGLSGYIPRRSDFEDAGGPFYFDPHALRPDPVADDQALWIRTDKGLIVCLGCCHAGLVNTLAYIRDIAAETRIRAVIGGLHLGAAGKVRLEKTAQALREVKPDLMVLCHCTGEAATTYLRDHLDCPVHTGYSGLRLDASEF